MDRIESGYSTQVGSLAGVKALWVRRPPYPPKLWSELQAAMLTGLLNRHG